MERLIFFKPEYLKWLWLIIPFILLLFLSVKIRLSSSRSLIGEKLFGKIISNISVKKIVLKKIFLIFAFALIIFALAGPQIGTKMVKLKRQGIDIVIAIDLSRSMNAEDIFPSRLSKTKHEVKNFINKLEGDRIALAGFTSKAYIQCPLTFDYDAALMFLDIMDVSLIPQDGTSLSEAIKVSSSVFSEEEAKHKLIILISDGEDHEEGVSEAVSEAVEKGIVVYTIGVGSPEGVPVPYNNGFLKDEEGKTVITKLNESVLKKIAMDGRGNYYFASTGETVLGDIFDDISRIEKKDFDEKIFKDYAHRFQLFLLAGILLLFADLFLSETKKEKSL